MTRHTDPVTHFPVSTIWVTSEPPGAWMEHAACRIHADHAEFFTEAKSFSDAGAALIVCAACPVRAACLDYGQTLEADGVWGGQLLQHGVIRQRYRRAAS